MKYFLNLFFLLVFCLFSFQKVQAQEIDVENIPSENASDFEPERFARLLFKNLNNFRYNNKKDYLLKDSILCQAAQTHANYMAEEELLVDKGPKPYKQVKERVEASGGSQYAKEIIYKFNIKNKAIATTYKSVSEAISYKLFKTKSDVKQLENESFTRLGVAGAINKNCNTIFVSIVLGNYRSSASFSSSKKNDQQPLFSKKGFRLKEYDAKICRKLDQKEDLSDWQANLKIEKGVVYFETDDYKGFKRLVKNPKDGLAVDIVQKKQFDCHSKTQSNHSTPWLGLLSKPLYSSKINSENIAEENAKYHLKIALADLPSSVSDYELNLLIIKDQHICKSIPPAYHYKSQDHYQIEASFVLDTNSQFNTFRYKAKNENAQLSFRVPFNKNKEVFEWKDIQKIIASLEQPDFFIDQIKIQAYSSVEGDESRNKTLQKKRAQSLVQLLQRFESSKEKIKDTQIITESNWADFRKDLKKSPYAFLAEKNKKYILNYIKRNHLIDSLEAILQQHRYAKVDLDIHYDLSGSEKEAQFVKYKFNQAVAKGLKIEALAIQKYILNNIAKHRYAPQLLNELNIPRNADFAGILMNQWAAQQKLGLLEINNNLRDNIKQLLDLVPENQYIQFNYAFCLMHLQAFDKETNIYKLRRRIDNLYKTSLPQAKIDELNIVFLFKVADYYEKHKSKRPSETFLSALDDFKKRINIEQMPQTNSEKTALLFIKLKSYEYAKRLLYELFKKEMISEDLLWNYIALLSQSQKGLNSNRLYDLLLKAYEMNPEKTKAILQSKAFSFQIYNNQRIKEWCCREGIAI